MHDGLNRDEGAERTIIDLPLEVKADGAPGSFEGYGAVFGNTDRDGDVVERGAFGQSLKERMPALLWQHNTKEPIGRFDVVKEDKKGLFVKGRLSMSGKGKEAYDLLKLGALNGLSIGFVTKEALRNRATGTRTIKRAELMEVSLVTFPANELARVNTVKASGSMLSAEGVETPRDFERLLREHGFSRSRAKAITNKGFKTTAQNNLQAAEINCLVETIDRRRERLELKRTFRNRIRLLEGTSKKGFLRANPSPPSIAIEVIPPFREADFECTVSFWTGEGAGLKKVGKTFRRGYTADAFRFRREDPVRPGNIMEGLRGLRFDRRMEFELRYLRSNRHPGVGASPQDEFIIIVS